MASQEELARQEAPKEDTPVEAEEENHRTCATSSCRGSNYHIQPLKKLLYFQLLRKPTLSSNQQQNQRQSRQRWDLSIHLPGNRKNSDATQLRDLTPESQQAKQLRMANITS